MAWRHGGVLIERYAGMHDLPARRQMPWAARSAVIHQIPSPLPLLEGVSASVPCAQASRRGRVALQGYWSLALLRANTTATAGTTFLPCGTDMSGADRCAPGVPSQNVSEAVVNQCAEVRACVRVCGRGCVPNPSTPLADRQLYCTALRGAALYGTARYCALRVSVELG